MELITVHTALNPVDADMVFSRLDAAEFHPSIKSDLAALGTSYPISVGGILVQVPDVEAEEAKAFLKDSTEIPGDVPPA
jgi:hypothetical protein